MVKNQLLNIFFLRLWIFLIFNNLNLILIEYFSVPTCVIVSSACKWHLHHNINKTLKEWTNLLNFY